MRYTAHCESMCTEPSLPKSECLPWAQESVGGLASAKLVVSVVATSRRKTRLWTGGKAITGWHAGMKQEFLAYFRVRRKYN